MTDAKLQKSLSQACLPSKPSCTTNYPRDGFQEKREADSLNKVDGTISALEKQDWEDNSNASITTEFVSSTDVLRNCQTPYQKDTTQ